jgi:hypothetical protein
MLLWYVGLSVLLVANVFRSAGVDYRLVVLGAILPLAVDVPFGGRSYGHTLLGTVSLLVVVMLATVGRPRLLRRRLLCLPIGAFCGLVLSAAWIDGDVFWWPLSGASLPRGALLPVTWVVIVEEVVGLVACWWAVGQFDLYHPGPRRTFLRTGRLQEST